MDQAARCDGRVSGRRLDERWLGRCGLHALLPSHASMHAMSACTRLTVSRVTDSRPVIGGCCCEYSRKQTRCQANAVSFALVDIMLTRSGFIMLWSMKPPSGLNNLMHHSPMLFRAGLPSELLGRILEVAADQMSLPPTALLAMRFTCRCVTRPQCLAVLTLHHCATFVVCCVTDKEQSPTKPTCVEQAVQAFWRGQDVIRCEPCVAVAGTGTARTARRSSG